MIRTRGWTVALLAGSVLGALLLASFVVLPPGLIPDADAPPAIDDAGVDAGPRSCFGAPTAVLPLPAPVASLVASGRATPRAALLAASLEVETNLPARAPPR